MSGWNNWTGFGEGQRGWKASGVMAGIMLVTTFMGYHDGHYGYAIFSSFVLGAHLEKMFTALDAK